jgi:uncharacterized OB-fold protein
MGKHYQTLHHDIWLPYKFSVGQAFHRFYEGLKEEKIFGNQCPQCKKILVPPRSFCPVCYVDMDEWVESSQEGEVVSWTLIHKKCYGMPYDPPFISALIRLKGTDCNFLHLIGGIDLGDGSRVAERIRRGSRVRAVWSEEKKGHMLDIKHFEPV